MGATPQTLTSGELFIYKR